MGILCQWNPRDGYLYCRIDPGIGEIRRTYGAGDVWGSSADHGTKSGRHGKPLSVPDAVCYLGQHGAEKERRKPGFIPDRGGAAETSEHL